MEDKKIDILDLILTLLLNKKKLVIHFFIASIISVAYSLWLDKIYKSTTTFFPPNFGSGSGLNALMQNFSVDILGGNDITKQQVATLLHSREIKEKVIQKFDLVKVYKTEKQKNFLDLAIKNLTQNTSIEVIEEGGLGFSDVIAISLTVSDKDSVRCAEIANYYVELLESKLVDLGTAKARGNRLFLEEKIQYYYSKLSEARDTFKKFQIEHKIFDVPQQLKNTLQSIGELKSEKISLEVTRDYLSKRHNAQNPQLVQINDKIHSLEQKVKEIEVKKDKDVLLGLVQSIDLGYVYADKLLEIETLSTVLSLLMQQMEQARIQESKDTPQLKVIDKARPPQWKSKPKRAYLVIILVSFYMFIFTCFILFKSAYYRSKEKGLTETHKKIDLIIHHFKFKRHLSQK